MNTYVYFPFTVSFTLANRPVALIGALLAGSKEVGIAIGSDVPAILTSIVGVVPTAQIEQPLGIPVTLAHLGGSGRMVTGRDGTTRAEVDVHGTARLDALPDIELDAILALEGDAPRLALVKLTVERPVTVTELLGSILHADVGDRLPAMREITDELQFGDTEMYVLAGADTYVFPRAGNATTSRTYTRGFHLRGELRVFGEVDFQVGVDVDRGAVDLVADAPSTAQLGVADFVELTKPQVHVSTGTNGLVVEVTVSKIAVFGSQIAESARIAYLAADKAFVGAFTIQLPAPANSDLTIELAWAKKAGFKIRRIGGLFDRELDLVEQLWKQLNEMRGSCEQIAKEWLAHLTQTTVTPSLNGTMTVDPADRSWMSVPLRLDYRLSSAHGQLLASAAIDFTARVRVPSSVGGLPAAIADSLAASAAHIAADILSSPGAYKAVAAEAMEAAGARALARMICRALFLVHDGDEAMKDVPRELADEAGKLGPESIAATAELAGQLVAVSLMGIGGVVAGLLDLLQQIADIFTGGSDTKKQEAEAQILAVRARAEQGLARIDATVLALSERLAVSALTTSLDDEGRIVASVAWTEGARPTVDGGLTLQYDLELLSGAPGSTDASLRPIPDASFPFVTDFASLPADAQYRMNARVRGVLKGATFLDAATSASLEDAIRSLDGTGNGVAQDFAASLALRRRALLDMNANGMATAWVYATTSEDLTVGRSRIGVNTRLARGA